MPRLMILVIVGRHVNVLRVNYTGHVDLLNWNRPNGNSPIGCPTYTRAECGPPVGLKVFVM